MVDAVYLHNTSAYGNHHQRGKRGGLNKGCSGERESRRRAAHRPKIISPKARSRAAVTPTPVAIGPSSAIGAVGERTLVISMPAGMRGALTRSAGG